MTEDQFIEILNNEDIGGSLIMEPGCNALNGLKIIEKYIPGAGIEGAEHDIIYSVDVDEIVKAGITEQDAVLLRELNWMVEDNTYLACFV